MLATRWIRGDVSLESGAFPPETPRGDFDKWQMSMIRLQGLTDNLSLYLGLQAQVADSNLDSSEKMMLGGSQGLRGYPLGEASADEAAMLNVELRYRIGASWQVPLLADGGYAKLMKEPPAGDDNHRVLSSAGLALDWQSRGGLQFSVTAASRTGEAARADRDDDVRIWAQTQWSF